MDTSHYEYGRQHWGSGYENCSAKESSCNIVDLSCNANFYRVDLTTCAACNVQFNNTCAITNGTGTQVCFHQHSSAGSTSSSQCTGADNCQVCFVSSCNSGYHPRQATNATVCDSDTYVVTYKPGEGTTGTNQTQNVTYNAAFTTKPSNTFSKSNATFAGWDPSNGATYSSANTSYTYTIIGNITLTALWNCNAGYTLNSTTKACDPCAAGTYKGSIGNAACTPTSAGYFAAGTGNTVQTACTQGSYTTTTGKAACTPCDRGKTNPAGVGNTACSANCAAITNLATWQQPAWSSNMCP